MNLKESLEIVKERWKVVALCIVAGIGLSITYSGASQPQYEATSLLYVSAQSQAGNAQSAYQGSLLSAERVKTYQQLVTTPAVLQPVIDSMRLPLTVEQLAGRVTPSSEVDTVLISLSVRDATPEQAVTVADAISASFVEVVNGLERPAEGGAQGPPPVVVRPVRGAFTDGTEVSPRWVQNIGLGIGLGGLIGLALAAVLARLDDTLKSSEAVQSAVRIPVVASVPEAKRESAEIVAAEAYKRLRTGILFSNVDQVNCVFLVTSPSESEGKTSTSLGVARALADAGNSVVIVEADMRRPTLGGRLGLASEVGLATVMIGRVPLVAAIQKAGRISVLCAGPLPPNPSELLGSSRMVEVLEELRRTFDYVIMDCPPVLPVTDTLVLAPLVDRVVVVVRYGQSTRDEVRKCMDALVGTSARILGVVLNCVPERGLKSYSYGYSPAQPAIEEEADTGVLDRGSVGAGGRPSPRRR